MRVACSVNHQQVCIFLRKPFSLPPSRWFWNSQDLKKGQILGLNMDPGVELVVADVLKPDQVWTCASLHSPFPAPWPFCPQRPALLGPSVYPSSDPHYDALYLPPHSLPYSSAAEGHDRGQGGYMRHGVPGIQPRWIRRGGRDRHHQPGGRGKEGRDPRGVDEGREPRDMDDEIGTLNLVDAARR